jgi:hypothetical protein
MGLIDDIRADIGDDEGIAPSGSITSLHNLLSSTHPDTVPTTPTKSAIIIGNDSSKWATLPSGDETSILSIKQGSAQWSSGHTSILLWGNNRIGSSTTTRYLSPFFDSTLAPTTTIQYVAPRDGIIRKMKVIHNTTNGNGNAIVYTLRKNSVPTSLSVSLASTTALGTNSIDSISVLEGDILDLEVTKSLGIGSGPRDIIISMEFV